MAIKTLRITCIGTPDDTAMKSQLSMIPGIVEMNIDTKSHCVDVRFDDARISGARIKACFNDPNYRMQS